ncbi:MAG: hypothetical protein K9K87_15885, partial [Desulfotignum sp.]|nr:hypothetical protein [Desulfotignum sp.]
MKTGLGLTKKTRFFMNVINVPFQIRKSKIFCISMQRNGTTSVGNFLRDHGFRVARWSDSRHNNWSYKWQLGDYEAIFNSIAFKSFQAYEDDPWWLPDFYRVLNYRFPKSKFILFHRDSDIWFNSMMRYSDGKTLGNTHRHCRVYRRLTEYYTRLEMDTLFKPTENEIDNLMVIDENLREHYKQVYDEYNKEAIDYFRKYGPNKIFVSRLEDKKKWIKLGKFLKIDVKSGYE